MLVAFSHNSHSQILRALKNHVKATAEQKAKEKINQGIDKAIDSIGSKKNKNKPVKSEPITEKTNADNGAAVTASVKTSGPEPTEQHEEGFIEFALSQTQLYPGNGLEVKGSSGVFEKLNKIEIFLIRENTTIVTKQIPLDKDGKFAVWFYAPKETGTYTIKAISSDKKAEKVEEFEVVDWVEIDRIGFENEEKVKRLETQFDKKMEAVLKEVSTKEATELKEKIKQIKDGITTVKKFYADMRQHLPLVVKDLNNGKSIPPHINDNISKLGEVLEENEKETQRLLDPIEAKQAPATICESFAAANETCAAMSLALCFTNPAGLIKKVVNTAKNIFLNYGPAFAGSVANDRTKAEPFTGDLKKTAAKWGVSMGWGQAFTDDNPLESAAGRFGFGLDAAQVAIGVAMRKYCNELKGYADQVYKCIYRNSRGEIWWSYEYTSRAELILRFPKSSGQGKIVNMQGVLEGNIMKYKFYQNVKVEDDFEKESKGRVIVKEWKVVNPPYIPFCVAEMDKGGFGAVARAGLPGVFGFVINAAYDKDAGTIRLNMVNEANNTNMETKVLFVVPVPIPLFRVQSFPINDPFKTINAVIKRYGEYQMKTAADKLSFGEKKTFRVGSATEPIEQSVELTLKLDQQ
jgi:hypothetical protein